MAGTLKLSSPGAEAYVPDGCSVAEACARVTHLGVCAHPDDLEILAYPGIAECFGRSDAAFGGVTVTDGRGSARTGPYAHYSDDEMVEVRKREQKKAAVVGEYAVQFLLNHSSAAVKDPKHAGVAADLDAVLSACRPRVVYTHNLADKHDTHVAVALRTIAALRRLPKDRRPVRVLGCEVWRDLDWLLDSDKVVLRADERENLADALMGVFDSQITGGKRYDLAARGRRLAHATFFESHGVDQAKGYVWAMDLTPLLEESADPVTHVKAHVERFWEDVRGRIEKFGIS